MPKAIAPDWLPLGSRDPRSLAEARLLCHYAVQLNTHLARAYIPARSDDSHTNLGWNPRFGALAGHFVETGGEPFQLAVRIRDLTLMLLDRNEHEVAERSLAGHTFSQAMDWVSGRLLDRGIDTKAFTEPLHFAIPSHPVGSGATFSPDREAAALAELSRYYGNAAALLESVAAANPGASPVRCWPHHFDIATLIPVGGPHEEESRTIGAGLSPGDDSYPQPYFYVTPWPYPDASSLPPLAGSGIFWHTHGWTGAVLLAEEIIRRISGPAQRESAKADLSQAVGALRALLAPL